MSFIINKLLTIKLFINLFYCSWWKIFYVWIGIKMYDLIAGFEGLKSSYLISKKTALEIFPMLRSEGLAAAIVYYDGVLYFQILK